MVVPQIVNLLSAGSTPAPSAKRVIETVDIRKGHTIIDYQTLVIGYKNAKLCR